MRRRIDPSQMATLVEVQRIRRAIADEALVAARAAEAEAHQREETLTIEAEAARDDWHDCLARPGFAPDYWRALAARLTARETTADEAAVATRHATDQHARRQDDWRAAEARVASIEERYRSVRRDAARRREDLRLDDLADRVTRAWMRP